MSTSFEAAVVLRERLAEHPATRAWRQLRPNGVPSEIRVLKERSKGIQKSAVYWLAEAGSGGRSVIAKCSRRSSAEAEALVYDEFLSSLGVPVPAYHGMVDEDGPFCWLFIGYVPGQRYSPMDPQHRRLAGRWIARLHDNAASLPGADRLPDRGMTHQLQTLEAGRGAIAAHGDDPSLSRAAALVLQRLAALLGEVRGSWSQLEEICAELPRTLVHGDLVRKNLRIEAAGNGAGMVAFDWERAGWGPPALDLAQSLLSERFAANACLDTYRSTCGSVPTPAHEDIELQATAGTVLRCLTAIHWTSLSLGPSWRERGDEARQDFLEKRPETVAKLDVYLAWLERSWRGLGAPARAS
jgi:aminoglycoside phosphotransferase (APT) family kinase protein